MADIDVAPVALSAPTSPAYLTTYRPALSIRNNGRGNVVATGYVRVYRAGQLVWQSAVTSPLIPPGESRSAPAADEWTPDQLGTYLFNGYATTVNDQVEPNNNLPSVTVVVIQGEPPEPPTVTAHASQHEAGSTDEIDVTGLPGELADDQPAKDHAGKHAQGGADEISVEGLQGTLATPQPTAAHANEKHLTPFATAANLTAHEGATAPHAAATNIEKTAHKDQPLGYAGLDGDGKLQSTALPPPNGDGSTATTPGTASDPGTSSGYAHDDHTHNSPGGVHHAWANGLGGQGNEIVLETHTFDAGDVVGDVDGYIFLRLAASFAWTNDPGATLKLRLRIGPAAAQPATNTVMGEVVLTSAVPQAEMPCLVECRCRVNIDDQASNALGSLIAHSATNAAPMILQETLGLLYYNVNCDTRMSFKVELTAQPSGGLMFNGTGDTAIEAL